jgi:hypothetical protein
VGIEYALPAAGLDASLDVVRSLWESAVPWASRSRPRSLAIGSTGSIRSGPIAIADPEGVRKRLLAQDNIGIVPRQETLHRPAQDFGSNSGVYDVMYYADLGRYKRRLTPFITWDLLPLLVPKPDGIGSSGAVQRSRSR